MLVLRPTGFGPCISGNSRQVILSNAPTEALHHHTLAHTNHAIPIKCAVAYGNINISLQRNVQLININAGAGFLADHGFAFCKNADT